MVKIGINVIPGMPVKEIIDTALAAEDIGYEYLILADEGFMQDVYVLLGAIARETHKMNLSPCTNGYTRHPAVTAAAMSSLHELSGGRGFVTLVAGGSVVLNPMNIRREAPIDVLRDTVEILRLLWSGNNVSYIGKCLSITNAQLSTSGKVDIPIWIAPRGEKMCQLTGEIGDGAVMTVKADLGESFALMDKSRKKSGRNPIRVFLDRMAYTPALIEETTAFFPHVIVDTPARQLRAFLREDQILKIQKEIREGSPETAKRLITFDMLNGYKIAGTPQECSQIFRSLAYEHKIDVYILNIVAGGFKKNLEYLKDVFTILKDSRCLAKS